MAKKSEDKKTYKVTVVLEWSINVTAADETDAHEIGADEFCDYIKYSSYWKDAKIKVKEVKEDE